MANPASASNNASNGATLRSKSRSRSPMVKPSRNPRMPSPHVQVRVRILQQANYGNCLLPQSFSLSLRLPWGKHVRKVTGDVRKTGENIILWSSLLWGTLEISRASPVDTWLTIGEPFPFDITLYHSLTQCAELTSLLIAAIIYLLWTHLSYFSLPKTLNPPQSPRVGSRHRRSSSPRTSSLPTRKDDFGYIWMTVPKNYRYVTFCVLRRVNP